MSDQPTRLTRNDEGRPRREPAPADAGADAERATCPIEPEPSPPLKPEKSRAARPARARPDRDRAKSIDVP